MIDTRRTPDHSQRAPRAGPITHPIKSGRCNCNPCLWLIAAHRAAVAGVVEDFDRILSTIVRANRNVWLLQSQASYLLQSNHTFPAVARLGVHSHRHHIPGLRRVELDGEGGGGERELDGIKGIVGAARGWRCTAA